MVKDTKPPVIDVEQVQAAERAAQRAVCNLPAGDLPEDLAKALERRMEVNLARAAERGDTDVRRVGGSDEQVRALEAPYRKRVAHTEPETGSTNPRGGQHRPAKKAVAKKAAAAPKPADPVGDNPEGTS